MASPTNQNNSNMQAGVLTKSGETQSAEFVVGPPTKIPVGQVVKYVAVLKLKYTPADFDQWKYFGASAWIVNEANTKDEAREKQPRIEPGSDKIGPIAMGYHIEFPGQPEKDGIYIAFPNLVFPKEGTFKLKFNLHAFKDKGDPKKEPITGDAGSKLSEQMITVEEMKGGLRNSPKDYDQTEREILTAIESYKGPILGIEPTIFVQLSAEDKKKLEEMKGNPEQATPKLVQG